MMVDRLIAAAGGVIILCATASYSAEIKKKSSAKAATQASRPEGSQKKLQATRKILIERMKTSREYLRESLPVYEQKLAGLSADFENKKKLYEEDLISKIDLDNSRQALTNTRLETERIRQWIAEDDAALALAEEEVAEAELARLPKLLLGAYDETPTLIRYNGTAPWSLEGAAKIAKFYLARFGRQLPISAMGQSSTHDRMGFDHRDALDVAVSPDSAEGRGLMTYLRKAGIPFLAFRGKVPSMSTGAHIHIGRPSPRLMEVRQRSGHPVAPEQSTEGG